MNTSMVLLALHCLKAPHNKLNTNIPPAATTKEERGYECTRGWYQMTVGEVHECLSQKRKAILKTGFSRFPTTSFSSETVENAQRGHR